MMKRKLKWFRVDAILIQKTNKKSEEKKTTTMKMNRNPTRMTDCRAEQRITKQGNKAMQGTANTQLTLSLANELMNARSNICTYVRCFSCGVVVVFIRRHQ